MGDNLKRLTVSGLALLASCGVSNVLMPDGSVGGDWGGDNAALIADDTSAHVHIGCTFGDAKVIIPDASGRFDVTGLYNVSAYPVGQGVFHPAHFTGVVAGRNMSLTVTLSDTARTLGPVTVVFGRQPTMGPCPICRSPAERARKAMLLKRP